MILRKLIVLELWFLTALVCSCLCGDPYQSLGVSRNADPSDIKRAYKKLAKRWHPDRNKDSGAQAKFVEVSDAYKLLSDPVKRDNFDRFGQAEAPQTFSGYRQAQPGHFYFRTANGYQFSFDESFNPFGEEDIQWRRRRNPTTPVASLSSRIWAKLLTLPGSFLDFLGRQDSFTVATGIITFGAILLLTVCFRYFDVDRSREDQEARARAARNAPVSVESVVHEMKAQTYTGLLRLQPPGCTTIMVLVDDATKTDFVANFGKFILPYRNVKRLTFAYLNLDKYLNWYRQLLRNTGADEDDEDRLRTIDVTHCRGTVLAMNNFKRCFSVFHPTLRQNLVREAEAEWLGLYGDSDSGESDVESLRHRRKRRRDGLQDSSVSGSEASVPVDLTLTGFDSWLDRMFDGQIAKIEVQKWPEFTGVRQSRTSHDTEKKRNHE